MEDLGDASKNNPGNLLEHQDETDIIPQVQNLQIQNIRNYVSAHCGLCAWESTPESEYEEHCTSDEHTIMQLITGITSTYYNWSNDPIPKESYDQIPEEAREFPSLHYCILCSIFCTDLTMYRSHLGDFTHSHLTQFMRATSFCKENIIVGPKVRDVPSFFIDFLKMLPCPPNYCKLCDKQCDGPKSLEDHQKDCKHEEIVKTAKTCVFCNITFVNPELYDFHLRTRDHAIVEDFRRKMMLTEHERMKTPQKHSYAPRYSYERPRLSLYYCKVCNVEFNNLEVYRRHRGIALHQRVERLIKRMSVVPLEIDEKEYEIALLMPRIHHCELCNEWCWSTKLYEDHVKTTEHLRQKSKYDVPNCDCSQRKKLF